MYTPYAVFDRIIGWLPAKNTVYTPYIYMALANPIYDHILGDFPAKNTVCIHRIYINIYMAGQPYLAVVRR
jgi:hypothetical protein